MKTFSCSECQQLLFFDNVTCMRCARGLAFLPDHQVMSALQPADDAPEHVVALAPIAKGARYRLCRNQTEHAVCNWAVPETDPSPLCASCRLNQEIPDVTVPEDKQAWARLEAAKRRTLYTLSALGLPIESRAERPQGGIAFAFKKDIPGADKVLTGHHEGLITINIAEANDPFREQTRFELGEAYRTLVGHFRHESGHYYWDRLIKGGPSLSGFRDLFGDERADYAAAIEAHYASGERAEASADFVSAYASIHPWEDWAETFAHYLHMVDTLDTARSYGLVLHAKPVARAGLADVRARRLDLEDFDALITAWVPLTIALNSFNQGMGLPDLYPFVLGDRTIDKLRFVHDVIERSAG